MRIQMHAPNRRRLEYLYLSLASADDVPCFASCVWIFERNPPTFAASEPSQKSIAHQSGDALRREVASLLRVAPTN